MSFGLYMMLLVLNRFPCRTYEKAYVELSVVEIVMDIQAYLKRKRAWIFGLVQNGTRGAHEASFGLAVSVGSPNTRNADR